MTLGASPALAPPSASCFSPGTTGHVLLPLFNQSEPLAPVIETFRRGVFTPSPQAAALSRPTRHCGDGLCGSPLKSLSTQGPPLPFALYTLEAESKSSSCLEPALL